MGWAATSIAVASLVLLLTNAQALNGWAAEQAPSDLMVRVTAATEEWVAITDRIGLAGPRDWLHARWKQGQAIRFDGQPSSAG